MKVLLIGGQGYIGSALYKHLSREGRYDLNLVDLGYFGTPLREPKFSRIDYRTLTKADLSGFDAVVLTAAHSSVPLCEWDPYGAFKNNVCNFVELLSKLTTQKFIYAGSSCVYKDTGGKAALEEELDFDPIDNLTLTKTVIDYYASKSQVEYYGLRFGSVNGDSPNFRGDLMINGMTTSSLNNQLIKVANPDKHRPILGMKDLVSAVAAILSCKEDKRGVYNVASFNSTIARIAFDVASVTGAPIERTPDTPTYDFSIDCGKFGRSFDWKPLETTETIVRGIIRGGSNRRASYRNILPDEERYCVSSN